MVLSAYNTWSPAVCLIVEGEVKELVLEMLGSLVEMYVYTRLL